MKPRRLRGRGTLSAVLLAGSFAVVVAACADVIGLAGVERVECVEDCGLEDVTISPHHDAGKHDAGKDAHSDAHSDAHKDAGPKGCSTDKDCKTAADPRCDLNTGLCVACLPTDDNCPKGSECKLFNTTYACAKGCSTSGNCPKGQSCCSHFCVDTKSNTGNCGKCGSVCSTNNVGLVECTNGVCDGLCDTGFQDCDMNKQKNGCETQTDGTDIANCGACGKACSANNMAVVSCDGGVCNGLCDPGFQDCDMNLQKNGCETQTGGIDIGNCGGCGTTCSANNMATVTCAAGICNGSCNPGFQNCNLNLQSDGCEVQVNGTDIGNCGGCGVICSPTNDTATCAGGACTSPCTAGFGNCDGNLQGSGCNCPAGPYGAVCYGAACIY